MKEPNSKVKWSKYSGLEGIKYYIGGEDASDTTDGTDDSGTNLKN